MNRSYQNVLVWLDWTIIKNSTLGKVTTSNIYYRLCIHPFNFELRTPSACANDFRNVINIADEPRHRPLLPVYDIEVHIPQEGS